ncbi:hypothetical protein RFI_38190 [Reticulomyxa filosa]|uniref:Uncharacterized protein n=1 Tax=Reticulomyxa filosa TaxID=46433 RepID=X6LEY3_RETFI|nr:hypothetical protein RFI_38190 [Reticulomyxa filosa]|eukprot:ETN99294.1 hypothetical protein RFI_38190 [Reticulomyxa filosa]
MWLHGENNSPFAGIDRLQSQVITGQCLAPMVPAKRCGVKDRLLSPKEKSSFKIKNSKDKRRRSQIDMKKLIQLRGPNHGKRCIGSNDRVRLVVDMTARRQIEVHLSRNDTDFGDLKDPQKEGTFLKISNDHPSFTIDPTHKRLCPVVSLCIRGAKVRFVSWILKK